MAKATIEAPVAILTRQKTAKITHLRNMSRKGIPVSVEDDFRISSAV